jgi:hypothetical protein
MGENRKACMLCLRNLQERDNLKNTVVKGWVILIWNLKKLDVGREGDLESSGSGQGQMAVSC